MIRVVVADDQDLVRIGLRALIGSEDGMSFAGEAADGLAVVSVVREWSARPRPALTSADR